MKSGIYIIRNSVNAKVYVGSAVSLKHRWEVHKSDLLLKKHHSILLQRFVNKYGFDVLRFAPLEYCEKEKLIEREQYWMDYFECCNPKMGYNICPTAGSSLGIKYTVEARKNMSIAHKGRRNSEASKEKNRVASTGVKHTAEAKAKMYGRKLSEETKAKMSESGKGRKKPPLTEEHKQKLSEVSKGRKKSPEAARNSALAHIGMKHSEEARKNMSLAKKGKKQPAEQIKKRTETQKRNKLAKQILALVS